MKIKNPYKSNTYIFNNAVGLEGFHYLFRVFNDKYDSYIKLLKDDLKSDTKIEIEYENIIDPYFEVSLYRNLIQIFVCTTIESLINTAGIHIFSEKYYKNTIERNNIITKIKLLIVMTNKVEIEDDNEILKIVKKLFDVRNSLVHPKSKYWNLMNIRLFAESSLDFTKNDAIKLKDDLYKVLDFFKQYKLVNSNYVDKYRDGLDLKSLLK